ncbi:lipoprotein LpqH [Gordonia sp. X0973]|nr:lipoprotein LpqH [Gordonia sp. X0973]
MHRAATIAVAAGLFVLGTAACGSKDDAPTVGGDATITVDGKPLDLPKNRVTCRTEDGKRYIGVGADRPNSGVAAVVTDAERPEVLSVGLGDVDGVTMGFAQGVGEGQGTVTKSGETYTIRGEATGINRADPTNPTKRRFHLTVRCP